MLLICSFNASFVLISLGHNAFSLGIIFYLFCVELYVILDFFMGGKVETRLEKKENHKARTGTTPGNHQSFKIIVLIRTKLS